MRSPNIKRLHRLLALLLSMLIIFSVCNTVPFSWAQPSESIEEETSLLEETQTEIKARLLHQIQSEGWDPYSSDMTIEEFYALMELFQDGTLPIEAEPSAPAIPVPEAEASAPDVPVIAALGIEEPGIDDPETEAPAEPEEPILIPRSLFMFSGLSEYEGENKPLDYDNTTGSDEADYPAGLAPYGMQYMRPPLGWAGVPVAAENKAVIIVPNKNAADPTITGDVDQTLFINYDGYYVRRVTVQNSEASVLGAIKLSGQNEYVYYYLTNDSQSTDVSTTTLPKGQKFIVQYNVREHHMNYQVRMDTPDGEDVTAKWADAIFGANRPHGTTDGYYSFVATAPYGYEMQIFRLVEGNSTPEEITGKEPATGHLHNNGYPLGREPVYDQYPGTGFRLNTNPNGPSTLMMSDTFFNDSVEADRTIIAVLKALPEPTFNAGNIVVTEGANGRGSSAIRFVTATNRATGVTETIPYDYEDEYLWRKYGMDGPSKYINYKVANGIGNITTGDGWGWKKDNITISTMEENEDEKGIYSYQWTFQTNSGNFLMDVLEVNAVPLTLPFFPKYSENGEATGTDKPGIRCWYKEFTLPHGINVKVEFLMSFGNVQRVYRVTVTNARSNVTITGLNQMMYGSGAPEISTYDFSGIYADATDSGQTNTSQAAIQYFNMGGAWQREAVANVIVNERGKSDMFNYENGDLQDHHGANIRFRLADGYDSPYYLFESSKDGIISGKGGENDLQASISRDKDGNIDFEKLNEIKRMSELADDELLDSQHIYDGGDGWCYIRLTQQEPYKMALLTIGAREVKYVVRYLPTYPESSTGEPAGAMTWDSITEPETTLLLPNGNFTGIIQDPDNVPEFEHIDDKCHPSFHKGTDNGIPGEHYDDKDGNYYDTVKDTVALVPLDNKNIPTDPKNGYTFVDWVLVDENYQPIIRDDSELHYLGNPITISDINEYAIKNDGLGASTVDVYVLRLMPTWKKVENPFSYKVALNWVDAQGELHEEFFSDLWRDVLTDWEIKNGGLTVKVLKDATPFANWIAQHPTYSFWDGVNNNNALYRYYNEYASEETDEQKVHEKAREAMTKEMEKAIAEYLPFLVVDGVITNQEQYDKVLKALCRRDISGANADGNNGNGQDDFWRLGEYAFQVLEDEGTIVIWMYENKGGLVFHKDVQDEPFVADDEFYFTVTNIMVGENNDMPLNGTYKAYPEKVYDNNGKERKILDKDAWVVTVKDGEISSIVKNDGSPAPDPPVNYFTLKNGEGIMLYAAPGQYTIAELGSKSGGNYKVKVTYVATDGSVIPDEKWDIPDETDLWLQGSEKQYHKQSVPGSIQQVAATVDFDIGQKDVVQTLTFCNQTCSLAVEVFLKAQAGVTIPDKYQSKYYSFNVAMNLPDGYTPLQDKDGSYYFNLVIYNTKDGTRVNDTRIIMKKVVQNTRALPSDMPGGMTWLGEIALRPDQRAAIVMNVPDQGGMINYWASEVVDWENTANSKLTPQYSTAQTGTVQAAECAEIRVVNWYGVLPDNGYLVVTEKGGKEGETFLYKITDMNDKELIISVIIGKDGTGKTVVECPLGVYTIKEITDWAWRYEAGQCVNPSMGNNTATVAVNSTHTETSPAHADFTNKRNSKVWLGSENNQPNHFGISK